MSTRTFTVADGRTLTLPKGLLAGPGATNARYHGGETFELPASSVDRFIRGRLRAGDLTEGPAPAAAPPPAPLRAKTPIPAFDLAAGHGKKEG